MSKSFSVGKSLQRQVANAPKIGYHAFMTADRRLLPRYFNWDDLIKAIGHLKPKEVSFDLFDTVISRTIANEAMVDWLIGNQLTKTSLWPETAETYLTARQKAYHDLGTCSIQTLYETEGLRIVKDVEQAAAIERAIEIDLCQPIPGVKKALDRLRKTYGSITFLSDMHLRQTDLQMILDRHELFKKGDRLIISGEVGASKHDGKLFTEVWPSNRAKVVHVGNNEFGDGFRAAQAGLKSITVDRANPTRYEKVFASKVGGFGPVIAGAAKKARLEVSPSGHPAENATAVGTQFIALSMQSFLLWVRAKAKRNSCKQLVFIAPDCELPLKMAQSMPDDYWAGFSLKHLHCDHLSWALAAASVVGVDAWVNQKADHDCLFLEQSSFSISVQKLMAGVGLDFSVAETSSHLSGIDLDGEFPIERAESWRSFLAEPDIRQKIGVESELRNTLVQKALQQSDLTSESMAIVDVGWRGYQAWLTSALIEEAFGNKTVNLHFGGGDMSPKIDQKIDLKRFAFDADTRQAPGKRDIACLQMFLTAGRPRLASYEWTDDGAAKEIFTSENKVVATQTIKDIWAGAERVAHHMLSLDECATFGLDPNNCDQLAEDVYKAITMFWDEPERRETSILKSLRFEDDDATIVGAVMTPYTAETYLAERTTKPVWNQGFLAASSTSSQAAIAGLRRVKSKLTR